MTSLKEKKELERKKKEAEIKNKLEELNKNNIQQPQIISPVLNIKKENINLSPAPEFNENNLEKEIEEDMKKLDNETKNDDDIKAEINRLKEVEKNYLLISHGRNEKSLNGFYSFINEYRSLFKEYYTGSDIKLNAYEIESRAMFQSFLKNGMFGNKDSPDYNRKVKSTDVISSLISIDGEQNLDVLIQKISASDKETNEVKLKIAQEIAGYVSRINHKKLLYNNDVIKPDTTINGMLDYVNNKIKDLNKNITESNNKGNKTSLLSELAIENDGSINAFDLIKHYILASVIYEESLKK